MTLQTFIFIHNQDIILDFIKNNKFNNLSNLTYIFLGNGETNKIIDLKNVIIAKNLQYNIETYPKLTAFSGWYALWKNNLIKAEYINLFEYDINIHPNLEKIITSIINSENIDVIGYIPFNVHDVSYIKNPNWSKNLLDSIENKYNININNYISNLDINKECSMTSNHTMSKKTFEDYMLWMDKLLDDIKNSPFAGHQTERSISIFYLVNNLNHKILLNLLEHFQFDSHETQGISQNKFYLNYNKLFK